MEFELFVPHVTSIDRTVGHRLKCLGEFSYSGASPVEGKLSPSPTLGLLLVVAFEVVH